MAIAAGTHIRLTGKNRPLPGAMAVALTAPGPVSVKPSGTVDGGSVPLEPIDDTTKRAVYWGYAIDQSKEIGEQPTLANGAIAEGFTGVEQGKLVFIGDDGALTHTAPDGVLDADAIGIGVRTTAIYFFAR